MTRSRPNIANLIALAAYWMVFAETLLLCARRVSKWQQQSASEAWGGAEMLELMARAALIDVMQDVREVQAREDTLTEDDRRAFRQLTGMAAILMALAFFASHLKAKLAGREISCRYVVGYMETMPVFLDDWHLQAGPELLDPG